MYRWLVNPASRAQTVRSDADRAAAVVEAEELAEAAAASRQEGMCARQMPLMRSCSVEEEEEVAVEGEGGAQRRARRRATMEASPPAYRI